MFFNILLVSILSVPLIYIKSAYPELSLAYDISTLFIISTIIFFTCYWFINKYIYGGGLRSFLQYINRFISFYTLVMGFSIHNSIAVLEGYVGKKSSFVRTPKFNKSKMKDNKYTIKKISFYSFIEIALALYFLFGMYASFKIVANSKETFCSLYQKKCHFAILQNDIFLFLFILF